MLFDPYGRIIEKPPAKPTTEMLGTVRVRDQWSTYPSVKLTPEKLAGIFREADGGDILRQAELFEEMEEKDPDLMSLFQTRKLAVQGLEFEILPASDSPEDKKIADHVKANIDDIDFDAAVLHLLDAIAKGFATLELGWDMKDALAWVHCLEWIPQKRWTFTELSAGWDTPLPKLPRLLTDAEPIRGVDVPPFQVIYHRYLARSGFAQRAGPMRTVGYYYLFKNYVIKDEVVYIEKFGQPLRIGKFTPGASDDDKRVLREALINLGTDAAALISDTTLLEILEAKSTQSSNDLFQRALEFFNKSYAKCILGQTATTEGTPGAIGAEQARSDVRHDLVEADAEALAKTFRYQLIWPMVGFNFGWDKALPQIRFAVQEPEDLEKTVLVHSALIDQGLDIGENFIRKKYGVPALEPGEKPLTPRAQPEPVNPFAALQLKKKALIPVGSRQIEMTDD